MRHRGQVRHRGQISSFKVLAHNGTRHFIYIFEVVEIISGLSLEHKSMFYIIFINNKSLNMSRMPFDAIPVMQGPIVHNVTYNVTRVKIETGALNVETHLGRSRVD